MYIFMVSADDLNDIINTPCDSRGYSKVKNNHLKQI